MVSSFNIFIDYAQQKTFLNAYTYISAIKKGNPEIA